MVHWASIKRCDDARYKPAESNWPIVGKVLVGELGRMRTSLAGKLPRNCLENRERRTGGRGRFWSSNYSRNPLLLSVKEG